MFIHWWQLVCSHGKYVDELLTTSLAVLHSSTSVIQTFQRYTLQLGQLWFAAKLSGTLATSLQWYIVIYKPGKLEGKLSQKSQTGVFWSQWFTCFPLPNCSLVLPSHFAVVFECKWKHFSTLEAAERNGLCGSTSSQNWTERSAHLSISLL